MNPYFFFVGDAPFNAVGDGVTDDLGAISAALAAAALTGGVVQLMPSHAISGTIPMSLSNVTLQGLGANGGTVINWIGAAGLPMLRVASPSGPTLPMQRNIWVKGIEFDGRGVAAVGVEWISVGWGGLDNIFVRDVTVEAYHFTCWPFPDLMAEPSNNHRCLFRDLQWRMMDSTPVRNAHGMVFDKAGGGNANNTSFSNFLILTGKTYNGSGIVINDGGADNCTFQNVYPQLVPPGVGAAMLSRSDENIWIDYSSNGATRYYGIANGNSFDPTKDMFIGYDVGNATPLPIYAPGTRATVLGFGRPTVSGSKNGNVALTSLLTAIGDKVASGMGLVHDITT